MSQKGIKVTLAGLEVLRGRKKALSVQLKKVQGGKGEAAEVGGNQWHDNFSFEELSRQEATINKQLADLNTLLNQADVVNPPTQFVVLEIGHIATFEYDDGTSRTLEVCGFGQSDVRADPPLIEYSAPLVKRFLGMPIGTTENVFVGGRTVMATLTGIRKKVV